MARRQVETTSTFGSAIFKLLQPDRTYKSYFRQGHHIFASDLRNIRSRPAGTLAFSRIGGTTAFPMTKEKAIRFRSISTDAPSGPFPLFSHLKNRYRDIRSPRVAQQRANATTEAKAVSKKDKIIAQQNALIAELQNSVLTLEKGLSETDIKVQQLNEEAKHEAINAIELQKYTSELEKGFHERDEKITSLDTEVNLKTAGASEVQNDVSVLEKELADRDAEIKVLKREIGQKTYEVQRAESRAEQAQKDAEAKEEFMERLDVKFRQLEKDFKNTKESNNNLKDMIRNLEASNAELKAALEHEKQSAQQQTEIQHTALGLTGINYGELQFQLHEAQQRDTVLQTEQQQMQGAHEQLQATNRELQNTFQQLRTVRERLERAYSYQKA
jgi:chromosome segregation ATPase